MCCRKTKFLSKKTGNLVASTPWFWRQKLIFSFFFSNIVLLLGLINSNSKFRLIQAFHKHFSYWKWLQRKIVRNQIVAICNTHFQMTFIIEVVQQLGVNTYYFLAKNCHATFLCKFYKLLTFMCYSRWYECYTTADIWAQKYQKAAFSAI